MESGLDGRVILITGASGGIGWAAAEAFASEGCRLILTGHANVSDLEARVGRHPAADRMVVARADVRGPAQVEAALASGCQRFGGVDVAIACAGVWPAKDVALARMPEARIREVIETDPGGAIWTARAFLARLEASRRSPTCLLFVGSTAGRFGEAGHAAYAAAKAALRGLMLSCAHEIVHIDARGRCNLVEPGWTATPMASGPLSNDADVRRALATSPLRRVARPDDVAAALLFLASPRLAGHLTGQTLTVAGGMAGRVLWEGGEIDPQEARGERNANERTRRDPGR